MRIFLVIAALLSAGPIQADYSNHRASLLYATRPCGEVIYIIDGSWTDATDIALQGMTWGYLIGYDRAIGGLHTNRSTTLERFRATCAANPRATGQQILQSLAG
ncbi:hypothetical protein GCM10011392_38750 [Wenxinia marina]|nr:hypothetical protein GCM10011392_38750 [Wenxinia marina]